MNKKIKKFADVFFKKNKKKQKKVKQKKNIDLNFIYKNKYFIFTLFCILFIAFVPKFIFFILAIILCGVAAFLNRFSPIEIGFELTTFFCVCFSIVFGSFVGVIFGIILMTTYLFASDDLKKRWAFIPLICVIPVAYIASIFPYEKYFSIAIFGFLLTFLYDFLFDVIFNLTLGRVNIVKRVVFYITHFYFNYILFLYFGYKIIALLN
ncbi:MAG: hypothetical protein B6U87_01670 [Candidatus Aenigmarchaeota archaeon ex4484_52]|nr:MAG: hypothetical protein B6U87_01670 [Candidatus Aenigmarchaeota archaeon ex4484_52]